jgi:hypothetical protein
VAWRRRSRKDREVAAVWRGRNGCGGGRPSSVRRRWRGGEVEHGAARWRRRHAPTPTCMHLARTYAHPTPPAPTPPPPITLTLPAPPPAYPSPEAALRRRMRRAGTLTPRCTPPTPPTALIRPPTRPYAAPPSYNPPPMRDPPGTPPYSNLPPSARRGVGGAVSRWAESGSGWNRRWGGCSLHPRSRGRGRAPRAGARVG